MPTQRVVAELVSHQSVQAFKSLAHIHRINGNVDFRRQGETEHLTPRPLESIAIALLRQIATSSQCAVHWVTPARILALAVVIRWRLQPIWTWVFASVATNPAS